MKQAIVRRKDGKTWLEGVPSLGFGRGRECTFAGALEAASNATEWPVDYDSIMGWSGLAFRLRWYAGDTGPRWCMSSPCGEFEREVEATRRTTGWELVMECRLDREDTAMEDFAPRIAEEIEAGRPVLACDPHLNMAVIVGCADAGRTVFLHDYLSGKPELDLATRRLGGLICFLGERSRPLDPLDALLEGLRIGVENWHRGHQPTLNGRYWHGHAAYLKWREELNAAVAMDEEQRRLLHTVSWWVYCSLADARAAAARFLRDHAHLLGGSRHRHLEEAVTVYEQQARRLGEPFVNRDAFHGPWTGLGLDDWTDEVRVREVAVLEESMELEAVAVGELENLLEASAAAMPAVH